mgnify:CR=1 FL=1
MADLTPNTDSARPESLNSLRAHLSAMQDASYVAEALVAAIVACGDDRRRGTLRIVLAEAAQEVLKDLGRGLDSVEIDRMVA